MNKQSSGQKKIFQIKVHAKKLLPGGNGGHVMLGYASFDMSNYIGKKDTMLDFELLKTKVPKAFVQFNITIVKETQMEDLESFKKNLAE